MKKQVELMKILALPHYIYTVDELFSTAVECRLSNYFDEIARKNNPIKINQFCLFQQ